MIRQLRALLFFGAVLCAPSLPAQLWQQLCQDSLRLDTAQRNVLGVKLDAMTFFSRQRIRFADSQRIFPARPLVATAPHLSAFA